MNSRFAARGPFAPRVEVRTGWWKVHRGGRWAGLALGAGCAWAVSMGGCSKGGQQPGGAAGFKPPPMPAETAAVVKGRVIDQFEAVGTIEAGEAITVMAEIDGMVENLPFREGSPIQKGGVIAKLEDSQLQAEVARAEALRDQAQATYERTKAVVDQSAGTPQDLDDAAAQLKVAEADYQLAKTRLAKTRIVAPWGGILGARRVSPGAFIRAGQEITDLASVREMKVSFSAPERYLGSLQRGAAVTVTTPAFPDEKIDGRIDVVEPVLDANTRSARILARVPNPNGNLRPGMSANITAVLRQRDAALTIPSEAVFVEGSTSFVYLVKPDSSVSRVAVGLGARTADMVEVHSGLEPGQHVVRAGHQKLFDGAKVIPVTSGAPGGTAGAAGGMGASSTGAPSTVGSGSEAGGSPPANPAGTTEAPKAGEKP